MLAEAARDGGRRLKRPFICCPRRAAGVATRGGTVVDGPLAGTTEGGTRSSPFPDDRGTSTTSSSSCWGGTLETEWGVGVADLLEELGGAALAGREIEAPRSALTRLCGAARRGESGSPGVVVTGREMELPRA